MEILDDSNNYFDIMIESILADKKLYTILVLSQFKLVLSLNQPKHPKNKSYNLIDH